MLTRDHAVETEAAFRRSEWERAVAENARVGLLWDCAPSIWFDAPNFSGFSWSRLMAKLGLTSPVAQTPAASCTQ